MLKILVPTDFSKNAQKAIDYAIRIAGKQGSEVLLLHVHEPIKTDLEPRWALFEEYNKAVSRELHDELKKLKQKISRENPGIRISAEFYEDAVRPGIIRAAYECKADLIVMGTQGASGLKKVFIGSVTASVIGNSPIPVLAIPRSFKWQRPGNILFATNQFDKNPEIIQPILKMTEMFGAHLHAVVFTETEIKNITTYARHESGLNAYQEYLKKIIPGINLISSHLEGKSFEIALRQYIDRNSIDMLVMIPREKGFWESIFSPGMTKKMAYRTTIPLLAVPDVRK